MYILCTCTVFHKKSRYCFSNKNQSHDLPCNVYIWKNIVGKDEKGTFRALFELPIDSMWNNNMIKTTAYTPIIVDRVWLLYFILWLIILTTRRGWWLRLRERGLPEHGERGEPALPGDQPLPETRLARPVHAGYNISYLRSFHLIARKLCTCLQWKSTLYLGIISLGLRRKNISFEFSVFFGVTKR